MVTGVSEKIFHLGAGQPMYGLTSNSVYGSSGTIGSTGFSYTSLNATSSSFANIGVMNEAYLSGLSTSKLDRWRLLLPSSTYYNL